MKPLTDRQRKVLEVLQRHLREHGFPPTLREIGQAIGLANVSAVRGHVSAIEKKGYIAKDSDKARSIRILHHPSFFSRIKRRLHDLARTDEGVLHRVVYGVALAVARGRPFFVESRRDDFMRALDREAVEHGWRLVDVKVEPSIVQLVVKVWPNHSPRLVADRIRHVGMGVCRRNPGFCPAGRLWAGPCALTTDPSELATLTALLLEEVAAKTHESTHP